MLKTLLQVFCWLRTYEFKENEKDFGSYWIKLHIGSKEVRYICDDIDKLREIVELWCGIHGKTISLDEKELVGEKQWD